MAGLVPDEQCDHVFKLLLIGDSGTGKSSLLTRFVDDEFDEEINATIGVDFKTKVLDVDEKRCKLIIWDTAGQERFRTLTASYYRGAHGVVFVYDVTRRETFNNIETWLEELGHYAGANDVVKMLVGNKSDLVKQREVTRAEGEECARKHALLFIEASAKTSEGVAQAFDELVQKIIDTPSVWSAATPSKDRVRLEEPQDEEGGACGGYCSLI